MSEPEIPVVTPEKTDASPEPSNDVISKEEVNDLIGSDLAKTMSPTVVKAESPEVADQEQTESEESTEESQEEATAAESESQAEEETKEEEPQTPPKTGKRVVKLIEKLKSKDVEIETLRAKLQEKVFAPEPVVQRAKEQTPEFWLEQYTANQRAGIPETDARQQQIAAQYEKLNDEVKFEKWEQKKSEKQALQNAKVAFVNSLVEIHEMNPFLVEKADSPLGIDVDFTSPIGRVMTTLSRKEGVPLNNAATITNYAQRANAIVLHQRLNGEGQNAVTLKRQLAEGQAKGTITSGTRRAPPQPKPESAKLDGLARKAQSGRRNDREALASAALASDLGM